MYSCYEGDDDCGDFNPADSDYNTDDDADGDDTIDDDSNEPAIIYSLMSYIGEHLEEASGKNVCIYIYSRWPPGSSSDVDYYKAVVFPDAPCPLGYLFKEI